jgi:hypothetical protein
VIVHAMVSGMVAENMQREHLGYSMAFVEAHFIAVLEEYGLYKREGHGDD